MKQQFGQLFLYNCNIEAQSKDFLDCSGMEMLAFLYKFHYNDLQMQDRKFLEDIHNLWY